MKKKWELIKEAYDRYPKGTRFNDIWDGVRHESCGHFGFVGEGIETMSGWLVYDGRTEEWATIVEAEPERKPLLRSEDGVDLFEGNKSWVPQYVDGKYGDPIMFIVKGSNTHDLSPRFSTLEAAEAWVVDKNRPREIKMPLYKDFRAVQFFAVVTKNDVSFYDESRKTPLLSIESEELEEIYAAHQKMKGGEHGA